MTEIPHEHDDEGNCIPPEGVAFMQPQMPKWRWSWWDITGIAVATVGGIFSVLGQGCALVQRECAAMAEWTRENYDLAVQAAQEEYERGQMAEAYERMVGMDTYWLETEAGEDG